MTRATLTAKMALTAKMRDCSRFMAWITLTPKWRPTRAHKKSRTQFWLSETSGIIYHLCSNRPDRVAQLAEHWASIPKVVGSIPTVDRHILQACPVWIYTQSNITSIIFT